MKKALMILAALCFVSSLAFAQGSSGSETVTIKGDIIDNMCLDAHKTEDFVGDNQKDTKSNNGGSLE